MSPFWVIFIIMIGLISLYNAWIAYRILKSVIWILTHVMVVGKKDQQDPDFVQIKKMFGIKEDPGK